MTLKWTKNWLSLAFEFHSILLEAKSPTNTASRIFSWEETYSINKKNSTNDIFYIKLHIDRLKDFA